METSQEIVQMLKLWGGAFAELIHNVIDLAVAGIWLYILIRAMWYVFEHGQRFEEFVKGWLTNTTTHEEGPEPVELTEQEIRVAATHEAGHVVTLLRSPTRQDKLEWACVETEVAPGSIEWSSMNDSDLISTETNGYERILEVLTGKYGGLVAEEIVAGAPLGYNVADLEQVVQIAHRAIYEEGLGRRDTEPPVSYTELLNRGVLLSERRSEELAQRVYKLLDAAHRRAREIITKDLELVKLIADCLVENKGEKVYAEELYQIADEYDGREDTNAAA